MKTKRELLTRRRLYTACALLLALAFNLLSFQGSRLLSFWRHHFDFMLPLDHQIRLVPWTIVIYIGAFVFWTVSLYFGSLQPRERSDRLFCADALTKLVSFLFFVFLPTMIMRPVDTGAGFFDRSIRLLYAADPGDNLFPSLHCCVSWLCWIWVRGKKDVPLFWRVCSLLAAIAVCISTLTTRQHVLADVAGGVLLAEACWAIAANDRVRGVYTRGMDWLLEALERRTRNE